MTVFFVGIGKRRTGNIARGQDIEAINIGDERGSLKGDVKVTVWTYYLLIEEGKKASFRVFSQGHDLDFAMHLVEVVPFPA